MNDLNHILVVSMCTKHCLKAVRWGISLARDHNAELFIAHIFHNPFGLVGWNLPVTLIETVEKESAAMKREAKDDLDRYIESEETTGLSINESIIDGNPMDEIPRIIENEKIDLLIMIAHEQERIEHFLLGREIHSLVRKMPCSILLVRRDLQ